MRIRTRLLIALASLALASSAFAQSPHGEAQVNGSERLGVKGCGRSGGPVTLDFAIEPLACIASILPCPDDGAWTLEGGSAALSGLSRGGPRGARLTLNDQSLAALESALEAEASALCGEPVDLSSLSASGALVISKDQEHARILLRARARATTANGDASFAIFRVRTRGSWMPALSQ